MHESLPVSVDPSTLVAEGQCANCLAPMSAHFCAQCGAPKLDERPITVGRFAEDLWHELTSLDSSTVRSLRSLLTRPGELTRTFLAGRTRWYLTPVRLYLLCFGLMIFVRSFTPLERQMSEVARRDFARRTASDPGLARLAAKSAAAGANMVDSLTESVRIAASNQWLHLIDPLTVGLLLAVLFWGRRRNFAEHVVFAIHLLAFNWLVSCVTALLFWWTGIVPGGINAVVLVQWLAIGIYFFLAARRVHDEQAVRAGLKTIVFVAGAQAAMAVVPVGVGITRFFLVGVKTGLFRG